MKYSNPVIKGFYPDPSVCKVNNKYYLVSSSFQYYPGVPLFESDDLVNWRQIGHCLTRQSQVHLEKIDSSGGVFACTIRYHNGRFYMTTTNNSTGQNFYVWTDDIYGEWSEPIFVDQGGIDPSFYFEGNLTYFMSNGTDDTGRNSIFQCEIDIETGEKLTPSRVIWHGAGGRYLESPHLYKINDLYYLMAAEGGTEYGHMIVYARGNSPYGPFEAYPNNPVLTNRNLGGYEIQGVGHGDLIQDHDGKWWIVHLGFRQIGRWVMHHHLGREVFLMPVTFHEDHWFTVGDDGTTQGEVETNYIPISAKQIEQTQYTFHNTSWDIDWCYLRYPDKQNYLLGDGELKLRGSQISLDMADSPTFIGLRQKDFHVEISCEIRVNDGEAGITLYMDEHHHYDFALRRIGERIEAVKRLNIGDIKTIHDQSDLNSNVAILKIISNHDTYSFQVISDGITIDLGSAQTRYLSSEVAGGFTGIVIGLYSQDGSCSEFNDFSDFKCTYFN
ncbi:glycoside hydrolase family 43 protein [Paenibacillus sp. FSL M7-1046]|uniref:glycoside hydrolase family 43 protein n=1 Tax=Paenibacillus sp. FSL M7-1046 TaxID=2975315 RepID=UPI0030F64497